MAETREVYYHNCRVLGENTIVPRALVSDVNNEFVLFHSNKCPFCKYEEPGTKVLARGVTKTDYGYEIKPAQAERLQENSDD